MKKEEPLYNKIVVDQDLYSIEPLLGGLFESGNRSNKLAYADMNYKNGLYTFVYDKESRCIDKQKSIFGLLNPFTHKKIILPESAAKLKIAQIDEWNLRERQESYGIYLLGPLYYYRVSGEKPLVNVANEMYKLSLKGGELERINPPNQSFQFQDLEFGLDISGKKNVFRGLYNYKTLEQFTLKDFPNAIPEHIIGFSIDTPWAIDPIGVSQFHLEPPYRNLVCYPLQQEYHAELNFFGATGKSKYLDHLREKATATRMAEKLDKQRPTKGLKL